MNIPIKAIEITFENLDYVRIPSNHIGNLKYEKLAVSITQEDGNVLFKHSSAKAIYLEILSTFECDIRNVDKSFDIYEAFDKRVFENDITCFRIHYKNDIYEDVWVTWEEDEDNQCKNCLQKVERNEAGNFVVQIG